MQVRLMQLYFFRGYMWHSSAILNEKEQSQVTLQNLASQEILIKWYEKRHSSSVDSAFESAFL